MRKLTRFTAGESFDVGVDRGSTASLVYDGRRPFAFKGMINDLSFPEDSWLTPREVADEIPSAGSRLIFQKRYRHKDGHVLHCVIWTSLIRDKQGQPDYFISHIEDITLRKQHEAELQQARNEAQAAQQALERANADLNLLAATDHATYAAKEAGRNCVRMV